MQNWGKDKKYFFLDESGDPIFFDNSGRCIVGEEGCSKILLIGFIMTDKPVHMRKEILKLRKEIMNDPYLKEVPSLKHTIKYFHASVDTPEVREKFFKMIQNFDFKAEFIVARKLISVFRKRHRSNPNVFYDDIVAKLFENKLHLAQESHIYYEVRGSRSRQQPFEDAIRTAISVFELKWGRKNDLEIKIYPMSSVGEPCLQIIDYMNWAVQRAFIQGDLRYIHFLESKISFIFDIYDLKKYPYNYYSKRNKFDLNKINPL
ncbi:MAG: hypothetical protein UT32_C0033G0008 [Parcubacteria group bacterium GW2011_GWC2_39_14]|nr:MAG: hypothetical protein UT32_C0033G0008 [Parcubacteria group bacterium GW2011_GWC2_39_14]KKR54223.1 MAG: hypothetical protein UT91_C0019G0009 [Parcubacteria group bacterium GW2011_GWA2_40_23]